MGERNVEKKPENHPQLKMTEIYFKNQLLNRNPSENGSGKKPLKTRREFIFLLD